MPSFQVQNVLKRLGRDIQVARKKRRMSVADFCERIGVTDKTLANLEKGHGGVRLDTLAMALLVLGELQRLEELLDPSRDAVGLVLDQGRLPQRISRRRKILKSGHDPSVEDREDNGELEVTAF